MNDALGAALGVVASLAINWGYFAQHGATRATERLLIRRPLRSLAALFANFAWLFGFALGWVGWAVYIAALRFAPISIVQASTSGGIGLVAVLSHVRGERSLSHAEAAGVALAIGGLALVALSLGASVANPPKISDGSVLLAVGVLSAFGALAAFSRRSRLGAGAALAVATGGFYSASDVASKAAVDGNGVVYFVPLLLVASVAGFVTMQLAFQRDSALVTAGLTTLVGSILPILVGFVTFHDQVPHGALGALRIVGFVGVVFGGSTLMRIAERPGAVAVPATAQQEKDSPSHSS